MCLIAFAIHASARWPLVIASNRDEFLDRPTEPLSRWQTPDGHAMVSGRDLRAGGSWLGATPAGRIAFLTNVREPERAAAPLSRGSLVTAWLTSTRPADRFITDLQAGPDLAADSYGGFNLVLGDFTCDDWWWVSNRQATAGALQAGWQSQALAPGIYGLSNATLDTAWPKTTRLKAVLAESMEKSRDLGDLQASLWQALEDDTRARIDLLPATGVAQAREHALSSAFVEFPECGYGTRSSTLLVAAANQARRSGTSDFGCSVEMLEREHLPSVPGKRQWHLRSEALSWERTATTA